MNSTCAAFWPFELEKRPHRVLRRVARRAEHFSALRLIDITPRLVLSDAACKPQSNRKSGARERATCAASWLLSSTRPRQSCQRSDHHHWQRATGNRRARGMTADRKKLHGNPISRSSKHRRKSSAPSTRLGPAVPGWLGLQIDIPSRMQRQNLSPHSRATLANRLVISSPQAPQPSLPPTVAKLCHDTCVPCWPKGIAPLSGKELRLDDRPVSYHWQAE